MVELLATTIISCRDAIGIVNRLSKVAGLSYQQKIELIQTLREHIPSCPVILEKNERPKRN